MISQQSLAGVDLVSSECFDCRDLFGYGNFQRCIFFLAMVSLCALHCHTLSFRLISGDVDHWCKRPGNPGLSVAAWRNVAIPLGDDGKRSRCTVYVHPHDSNGTQTEPCYSWDYDPARERSSIVSQWDLVCHRRILKNLAQAVYVAGSLVFMSTVGFVADQNGRMPVIFLAVATLVFATLGGCTASAYAPYLVSRFLNSGCAATVAVLSTTLLFEVSPHEIRNAHVSAAVTIGMIVAELWFAVGRLLQLAEWILLQIFMLSPTVLTLFAFSAVHESPRWYVARGDMLSAEVIVMSAAKENCFPLDATSSMMNKLKAEAARNEARVQVDRDANVAEVRRLKRYAFAMFVTYFSVAFTVFTVIDLESSVSSLAGAWYNGTSNATNVAAFAMLYAGLAAFPMVPARRLLVAAMACAGSRRVFDQRELRDRVQAFSPRCRSLRPSRSRTRSTSGREDLLFALAGVMLFAALLVQLSLPLPANRQTLLQAVVPAPCKGVDYMKQTLDPLPAPNPKARRRKPSEVPSLSKAGLAVSKPGERQ
ncbi:hypothetical protein HPB50_008007 [Hyalomma asiaticum]|uniref:Uncharacterized protein n=1 Tax=Hyalomma asiaticum TaxID=266040 RepID=A0ACB7SM35_HYAAI|nr:hypothetical protein HPB50_008007 [Hyalomma asiaticum]